MLPTTFGSNGIVWETFEPTTSNGAAVVLVYGSDGMAPTWAQMIRSHAKAFADAGYTVVIPDYFSATATPSGQGQAVFSLISKHFDAWQAVIEEAVTEAGKLTGITAGHVGLVGYSLGATLSLYTRDRVPVVVDFFGFYHPRLRDRSNPSLHAQIHHGANDFLPYNDHAVPIAKQLQNDGATVDLISAYPGAGHGFVGNDQQNADAQDKSLKATLAFLKTHLP